MHIPDGFLSLQVCATTYAISCIFWIYGFRGTRRTFDDRHVPLLSIFTAMFFAAQMMNYPIIGGTTAHLLGGPVLALLLGPYAGLVSMTVILLLQALIFGDGGLSTFGANVLNMGIIGVFVPYLVFMAFTKMIRSKRGLYAGIFLGSFLGDLLAAVSAGFELGLSVPVFQYGVSLAVTAMVIHHSIIGVVEGIVTSIIIVTIAKSRPDLLDLPKAAPSSFGGWRYSALVS
ncbi:MAG: energy-coupling factor ABC transporter permease [Thermoproteota archaeon]